MAIEGNSETIRQYSIELKPYDDNGLDIKHDYPDPNMGWKIHLNVAPSNVKNVSTFLLDNGYSHKYLKANVDAGKIFTVYTGSKTLTEQLVKEIYKGVGGFLEDPKTTQDILVAPRIAARFVAGNSHLFQGGPAYSGGSIRGIPIRKMYETEDSEELYQASKALALQVFGDYFGGGIEYYNP